MRFCNLEMSHIPTSEHPFGSGQSQGGAHERTLGHACKGKLIDSCNGFWRFKQTDLDKHGLTQLEALETMLCATCTPQRLINPQETNGRAHATRH